MSKILKSISTNSTIISTPITFNFSSSTDIHHPLISDCPSTDMPNCSYLLKTTTTPSTDIPHPLTVIAQIPNVSTSISSAYDLIVAQSLLGLREGSEMSERLGCSQAKREDESSTKHAISLGKSKESERSATLVGEGEGVRSVRQGEPLIQEKRENERKAGTEI